MAFFERSDKVVLTVWEEVSISLEGRADVLVAHAMLDWERISSIVDHEGSGSVAQFVKGQRSKT
jgi:hypothetical protein